MRTAQLIQLFCLLLIATVVPSSMARNEWLSARIVNGKSVPLSVESLKNPLPIASGIAPNSALISAASDRAQIPDYVLFDVTMSIPDDPAGDNDGNSQGLPGSVEQDKWERIVQHFADAVFEMTEGVHRIRRVRIFRKGRFANGADIVWNTKGHPHVVQGVGEPGGRINMYKIFAGGNGSSDKDMLADEIGSGYTIAHEWGHYFYGVYDEYPKESTDVGVSPSIMNSQWRAKSDTRWLNFSIKNTGGGDYQNTLLTRQHRVHEASVWETLVRNPLDDPRLGSLGRRIRYPELAYVAPSGSATPRIDLPDSGARADLDILWVDKVVFELVIDNSGSMNGAPLENAKTAAKLLVDRTEVGEARVGVVQFSTGAQVVYPVTTIDSEQTKQLIKSAIDAIEADAMTAIGEGALLGLNQIVGSGSAEDTGVVFLLSDGESNSGIDPLSVIPDYQTAQVPLFTFAFGSGADSHTLRTMATQTGGKFYYSPTTLSQIALAFQDAFSSAVSEATLTHGEFAILPNRSIKTRFPVESGIAELRLSAIAPEGAVGMELISPRGQRVSPSSVNSSGGESAFSFRVANPLAGNWMLSVESQGEGAIVNFQAEVTGGSGSLALNAYSLDGSEVAFPAPVLIRARLNGERPVVGAIVEALAVAPSGNTVPVILKDDGKAPDETKNDGQYSALFYYTENGTHEFVVRMDNRRKGAKFTSAGMENSLPESGGRLPVERDAKVGQDFVRSTRFSVTTHNGIFASHLFQLPAGTYAAMIVDDENRHSRSGMVTVALRAKGALSGTLHYAGATYRFSGKFNTNGGFATNLKRKSGQPLQLNLQIDALNGSDSMTGTLNDGGGRSSFSARRAFYDANFTPAPQEGYYTCIFAADDQADPVTSPQGHGFATFTVGKDGKTSYAGKLADGTTFTGTSRTAPDNTMPIYLPLYRGNGAVFGLCRFENNPGISDFAGTLTWHKAPSSSSSTYRAGIRARVTALGSAYPRITRGTRFINAPDGSLRLEGEGMNGSIDAAFTLDTNNRFTIAPPNTAKITLTANPAAGLLQGSFLHPVSGIRTPFQAAVLRKQNSAAGYFTDSTGTGAFEITSAIEPAIPVRHQSGDIPRNIPDNNPAGITSSLVVNQPGNVARCRVSLNIVHTYRGDLIVTLIAPSGRQIILSDREGSSADNLSITDREVPQLVGENASGTWRLAVADVAGSDIGALTAWSIELIAE